ncbi:MAG TPA: alpha/beta hydrolase [Polyangia bacterium]|nr:alpha/beta hydrolase [Polyangia bacterium]
MEQTRRKAGRAQTLRIDDLDVYVEEYGEGEPLVLLHGYGGCSRNWYPFTPELAERHRLILVDLRGHGGSTNPRDAFTHREAASDVLGVLDRLGVGRFSAMGISTGGMTLLHMATRQPERIEAMVLVSATTHFPAQARAIMRAATFDRMPPPVQAMYRDCARRGDAQIRQLIAHFNALSENHDDMNFSTHDLAAITTRTLVVHGDRDRFFPVEIAVDLYRSLPNAALWIIPGGDHVPIYDGQVGFTSRALRFMAEPTSR